MKEKPKFYCETCGREVPADVDECPYCGMAFYGVMCPRCGHSGPASEFSKGCPKCGYRSPGGEGFGKSGSDKQAAIPLMGITEIHGIDEEKKSERSSLWGPLLVIILLGILGGGIILYLLQ